MADSEPFITVSVVSLEKSSLCIKLFIQPGLEPQSAQQRNPAIVEAEINQTLANNPEVVARIRAAIEAGIQSGELDINELNTLIFFESIAGEGTSTISVFPLFKFCVNNVF